MEKSRIVCSNPKIELPTEAENKFIFLGYEFRPRLVRSKYGTLFIGFTPAISPQAEKAIRDEVKSWEILRWTPDSLDKIARFMSPIIQGWINYYGRFQISSLKKVPTYIDLQLVRWVKKNIGKRENTSFKQDCG